MFKLIKQGRRQPTLEKVMSHPEDAYLNGKKQDVEMIDLLLSFPGINIGNVYGIVRRISCVRDICSWTKAKMEEVLSPSDADSLYSFLHTPFKK